MISVIIPVYNVEKYLDTCIKSVLEQTYQDFEIILIDDGSPDNCPQMCDEWALRDKRIRVIHKENGGLSSARNAGLEAVKGEYVFFLDSDDWVIENAFEILVSKITEEKSDMVIYAYHEYTDEKFLIRKMSFLLPCGEFDKIQVLDMFKQNVIEMVITWSKLYKKKIFDNIRFPINKIHEDEFTAHFIINACEKISIINDALYCYRQNPDSIMNTLTHLRASDVVLAYYERINLLEKYKLEDAVQNQIQNLYNTFKYHYPNLVFGNSKEKEKANLIFNIYKEMHPKVKKCVHLKNFKDRIIIKCLKYIPKIYSKIYLSVYKK